jgi:SAM-dependent methyltransferase
MTWTPTATQAGYDQVADEYAGQFDDEMAKKPFDRMLLDWLAQKVAGAGPICDMGCGPGQIARYLHSRGVAACGVDLSPAMVAHAQRRNPAIPFQQGNLLALPDVTDDSYGGIAAFYSIIHIPRPLVVEALRECRRVLQPQGHLLLTFHIGQEIRHLDAWWDKPVDLDFIFFDKAEMREYLSAAGFIIEEVIERDPYPEIEVQTQRAYLFARKA